MPRAAPEHLGSRERPYWDVIAWRDKSIVPGTDSKQIRLIPGTRKNARLLAFSNPEGEPW